MCIDLIDNLRSEDRKIHLKRFKQNCVASLNTGSERVTV